MLTPSSPASSVDSLFDGTGDDDNGGEYTRPEVKNSEEIRIASRTPPPIPGLYVFPSLLPPEVASE